MARERQAEEVPGENTYLVCLLRDDTVEAIRAESYKSREKKTLAQERKAARLRKREIEKRDPKELRRLREAGVLLPDSGISCVDDFKGFNEFVEAYNDPLLSTQFVRREFYWKLNKEQMQRVVARYYGWEKWAEDPWGSFQKFCEWLDNARDNEMAVWAVNETSKGREYLVHSILEGLGQLDYSEITEKALSFQLGYGAACFLHTKNYTGWDYFHNHYPGEPLPVALVNEKVSKVYPFDHKFPYSEMTLKPDGSFDIPERVRQESLEGLEDYLCLFIDPRNYGPFTSYRFLVFGIYNWLFVSHELQSRIKGHRGLASIIGYKSATNLSMADVARKLSPKDYRLLDKNGWWKEIDKVTKRVQKHLAGKYPDKSQIGREEYADESQVDPKTIEWEQKRKYANVEQALLDAVDYWISQPLDKLIKDGPKLLASLQLRTKSNLINTLEKENPQFAAFRKAKRKAEIKKKPANKAERLELLDKIKLLRDSVGSREPVEPLGRELIRLVYKDLTAAKAPLSLDKEFEDGDGDTYSLGDKIEDKRIQGLPEQSEEQELLKVINEKWSPRERMVIRLYSEGESDKDIALALEEKFGKSSSEESVRKFRQRARGKAKQVREESENS